MGCSCRIKIVVDPTHGLLGIRIGIGNGKSAFSRFDPTVKVLDNTNISSVSRGMYTYPKTEEKKLLNSVTTQNTEQVLVTLCDIIRKVRVQQLSDKVCKSIYISILNNLKNELEEVHCNTTAFLAEIQKYMLAAHTCAADIHNDFSVIIYHLSLVMERNPSVSDGASFAEKISAYIQQNLHDYALSLNTVAEYVHKSPSYVTKLYREQTGYTVKESIDIARISPWPKNCCWSLRALRCRKLPVKPVLWMSAAFAESSNPWWALPPPITGSSNGFFIYPEELQTIL